MRIRSIVGLERAKFPMFLKACHNIVMLHGLVNLTISLFLVLFAEIKLRIRGLFK
jgi:hypothetical protein